jgi:hypothetical protein
MRTLKRNEAARFNKLIDTLESRQLMAGTAVLSGGTLVVNGTSGFDAITVAPSTVVNDGRSTLVGGTTSVFLNLPLLSSAAGLNLTSANSDGRPASSAYQVGFPILPSTDFRYAVPFSPAGGTIRHSGTVTFNNSVTVGDFDIGFDASRATNGRSGFFVASTTGVKATLFDLGSPSSLSASRGLLRIGRTPLLVSPEFANFLGNPKLTGAEVGAAAVNGAASFAKVRTIGVNFAFGPKFSFDSSAVSSIVVNSGGGGDLVTLSQLDYGGALTVNLGGSGFGFGSNSVSLNEVAVRKLDVVGSAGADNVSIINSAIVDTNVSLGTGFGDAFNSRNSFFSGRRSIVGSGFFSFASATGTDLTRDAFRNFGNVQII